MKYLIIGNSAAAIGAVEAIRRNDKGSPVTIISDEPHHVYSRPLISYLLAGYVTKNKMFYRDENFYRDNNVETVFNKKVTGIDTKKKQAILDDKKRINYDRLLIATGGTPFIPPIKGKERECLCLYKVERCSGDNKNLYLPHPLLTKEGGSKEGSGCRCRNDWTQGYLGA